MAIRESENYFNFTTMKNLKNRILPAVQVFFLLHICGFGLAPSIHYFYLKLQQASGFLVSGAYVVNMLLNAAEIIMLLFAVGIIIQQLRK